ncbi:Fibronectin-binding A domain protein [Stanieria cyanosphaera PCC 7437]|uniref:Rqc2 homolog RqcH n=1 Tax=Stanieria cyanosphaera (strain ATCC 29371 / PCC 7437) TaxID=111780 RepID=K9XU68_STAC7|nr:NFACT RNA binding domain-containing protein [Stanieria cyanosphaera]AFZ35621.1 Fibronectin-binding A domain protein [Stanieria cyanosphaera PCC 7437]
MQPVDYTTLIAVSSDLKSNWLPARIEQVYQRDRYTINLALRNLKTRKWLTIGWHPQAARICLGSPPPRVPDTFTFSDQLRHQLNGLALIEIVNLAPWERVLDLQFAQRPGEEPLWHLYVEIMGKYSNVILVDASGQIVTAAHQVNANQSSLRQIQTGQPYQIPPPLTGTIPKLQESKSSWQARVSLIPGKLQRQLLNSYRGLSPKVASEIIAAAELSPEQTTESLHSSDWQQLFRYWQKWLQTLATSAFKPAWFQDGYTVLGWQDLATADNIHHILDKYYTQELEKQEFQQIKHQLSQKITNLLKKLQQKADIFRQRLEQSDRSEEYRSQADLLMAHLQQWQPGMKSITLADFATGEPVKIPLNPEKNAVQNAQSLYKNHQKLKRAKTTVQPLLEAVESEINYLQQVQTALNQIENYQNSADLQTLTEIREELIQQEYLQTERQPNRSVDQDSQPYRYTTPSGFELWVGRNNRQNEQLTFRIAGDYDLWFHTQEIPGSHVLLRLQPGAVPDQADLQFSADLAAYHSQARESEQVPVVYTEPKNVYKPKGAKPGMAIYKRETVIWGRPQQSKKLLV